MNLFLFPEKYQKNLLCMQEVLDKLLSHMKGHGWSFRKEITDRKGNFSQKKLDSLIEELLSLWETQLREGADIDPATGKSVAESYIKARRELYRGYLYVVMRCTLCKDAYVHAYGYIMGSEVNDKGIREYTYVHSRGDDVKERSDFDFLLKQAERLSRSWCVLADSNGRKWNEPYEGYDRNFGFHLYHVLMTPLDMLDYTFPPDDSTLTPEWRRPCEHLQLLTDEGNEKRFFTSHLAFKRKKHASAFPAGEDVYDGMEDYKTDEDDHDSMEDYETDEDDHDGAKDYDADEDGYDSMEDYKTDEDAEYDDEGMAGAFDYDEEDWEWDYNAEFEEGRLEQLEEEADRGEWLKYHAMSFEYQEEYLEACRSFKTHFEKAAPDVLRGFHEDLEEIVDLYLANREISSLMDTDKTLDVYGLVCDGACRQAGRYERGSKWKNM